MTGSREDEVPDRQLVRAYMSDPEGPGGRSAASELFRRHRDRLYLWCLRRTGEHEAAMDLAQETLLAAFQSLPRFEGRSEFRSWLFAIARNRFVSGLRSGSRSIGDDAIGHETIESPDPNPEEQIIARDGEERALALLRQVLDKDEQTALWLRCYEGVSVEEIGRMLYLSDEDGARVVLQRARRKLRAAIAGGALR